MQHHRKDKRATRGVLSPQEQDHPPNGISQSAVPGGSFVFSQTLPPALQLQLSRVQEEHNEVLQQDLF